MKVMEASKRSGLFSKSYALAIVTIIDENHPIESEIRHVNEAMINWFKSRGAKCITLMLTYTAASELHDAIIEQSTLLVNQDFEFNSILNVLEVSIALLDANGKLVKELELKRQ
ncbi:hypothetical protein JXQ70_16935 [bacterium]|nr:hypothetical protein [bacterium]